MKPETGALMVTDGTAIQEWTWRREIKLSRSSLELTGHLILFSFIILEGVNGVPLKSVISKISAKKSVISKISAKKISNQ